MGGLLGVVGYRGSKSFFAGAVGDGGGFSNVLYSLLIGKCELQIVCAINNWTSFGFASRPLPGLTQYS